MRILDGVAGLTAVLAWISLVVRAFALIDALTRPAAAFEAAGKLTKNGWLLILVIALVVGVLGIGGFVGILNIAALIAAILYIVDVRPAVRQLGGPRRRSTDSW